MQAQRQEGLWCDARGRAGRSENGETAQGDSDPEPTQGCPTFPLPRPYVSLVLGKKLPFHMVGSGWCNFSLRVNCFVDSTDN